MRAGTPTYPSCLCLTVRRMSRLITQAFDARLAPTGLKATQFSILAALASARRDGARLSSLAANLDLDASTLSRSVKPLIREGLVELVPGRDARERNARLTRAGRARLRRATPHWEAAQRDALAALGRDSSGVLRGLLSQARQI